MSILYGSYTLYIIYMTHGRKEYGFQREMKGSKKRTIYEFCRTRGIGAAKPLETRTTGQRDLADGLFERN